MGIVTLHGEPWLRIEDVDVIGFRILLIAYVHVSDVLHISGR